MKSQYQCLMLCEGSMVVGSFGRLLPAFGGELVGCLEWWWWMFGSGERSRRQSPLVLLQQSIG